jgi:hypothetical protein
MSDGRDAGGREMNNMTTRAAGILFSFTLLFACADSSAHKLALDECKEGSEFIKNAALSRENGMAKQQFVDILHQDVEAIHAFPPRLRWFMQDEEDEYFLLRAADDVFDKPQKPELHRRAFLESCLARSNELVL